MQQFKERSGKHLDNDEEDDEEDINAKFKK